MKCKRCEQTLTLPDEIEQGAHKDASICCISLRIEVERLLDNNASLASRLTDVLNELEQLKKSDKENFYRAENAEHELRKIQNMTTTFLCNS